MKASISHTLMPTKRTSGCANALFDIVVKSRETRADRDHEIGVAREPVGRERARHANRAHRLRVIPGDRALAGLRFGHRDAGGFGKRRKASEASL